MGKICSLFLPQLEISHAAMGESSTYLLPCHPICYTDRISFLFSFFLCCNCFGIIQWGYNFPEIHRILLDSSWLFSAELGVN